MITLNEAQTLARQLLHSRQVAFGDCVQILEFPDNTVTLHFAKPFAQIMRNGNVVEISQSPATIIVMVDRSDSTAWMLGQV